MNHQNIKETLLAFHDAELREEERLEIAAHLSSCVECRNILKRWETISSTFNWAHSVEPSEAFVNKVINRLAHLEEDQASLVIRRSFPSWLLPALGYGFAFFLMFMAIAYRELPVNTETILLADVPQASHWTFGAEQPDANKLVELP